MQITCDCIHLGILENSDSRMNDNVLEVQG